jgi:hypothetical protein
MTKAARIVKLRMTERRIAATNCARAEQALANLAHMADRLASLQSEQMATQGTATGIALKSRAELAMRLDHAQSSLTTPKLVAKRDVQLKRADHQHAQRREESAKKIHDRAASLAKCAANMRRDANRPFRKPTIFLGDDI